MSEDILSTRLPATDVATDIEVIGADDQMVGTGTSKKLLLGFVPVGLLLAFFFLVPLILMVLYSLWTMDGFNIVPHWTLDNYRNFIGFNMYTRILLKTFGISLAVALFTLVAGYPFAYFLVRCVSKRWQVPLLILVIIPFWTSYLLRVYAWMGILGRKGLINQAFMSLGIIKEPLEFLLYNTFAVVLVFIYLYLSFVIITLYSALEKFDFTQVDAAMDLGATPMRAFVEITLPQTKPGLITAFLFVFIPMLGEYITPKLIGGTTGTMIANLIVNLFRGFQYPQGSAVALSIAFCICLLVFMLRKYVRIDEIV